MGLPLDGLCIALSGVFPGRRSHSNIEEELINALGATLAKTVNRNATHLVTTEADFDKPSSKVAEARNKSVPMVKIEWLEDCLAQSQILDDAKYSFGTSSTKGTATTTNGKGKHAASVSDDEDVKPKKKAKATLARSRSASVASIASVQYDNKNIPIDEECYLQGYYVYVDDDSVIYDASLNQTNAGKNNNKFYRVQLLRDPSDQYRTWTRWGRVGERGQNALLGDGGFSDAFKHFQAKFKAKSGLSWENRGENPKPGKYTFVEISYAPDSDTENEVKPEIKTEEPSEAPLSKLPSAVQDLMALIFNQEYFANTMTSFNYDANKMPLGKLSKNAISRGYQALKSLAELLNDHSLAASEYNLSYSEATEYLSNQFYSFIPHAFGRNTPPVIRSDEMLQKEVELLQSLGDMKDAENIMNLKSKSLEQVNILDKHYQGLSMDEMTPLDPKSNEFMELQNYLVETRGATHSVNYKVDQIFRIARKDERNRFTQGEFAGPPRDRRLLWHGSRCTNFGGILSQGLRIAPPEAPVSGYMFGKGIYLADMSSKSANYCASYTSNGQALLLLCEAELGNPTQKLTDASYSAGEDAKSQGMYSTWGQGTFGPPQWKDARCVHPSLSGISLPDVTTKPSPTNVANAYLQYNEYITYDVAQVRLRYLFRVRM